MVWQDAALCDNLGVGANLFLGREGGGWLVSDIKANQEARKVLAGYGIRLTDVSTVRALSAGQRQLLAVARAMQRQPSLLVLDEPTASLGVQEARQVEQLIRRLKERGTTVLLVSHDIDQVFQLADRILVLHRGRVAADLSPSDTHPADVVAIMSGHAPDASARHQLTRLQSLVDQLASATPNSSLPLIVSALSSALGMEQLCIHLLEDRSLRLVAAVGLPGPLSFAWSVLPAGLGGGPMAEVVASGRIVVHEDVGTAPDWAPYWKAASAAGIRSSWSVPLIGTTGLIGVVTGCQPFVGRPQRDEMELVSLYAGYAAGTIERDRLFGEVTARNRVLETIREVLETLAGPEPVSTGISQALCSLRRGLRCSEVELWTRPPGSQPHCSVLVDQFGEPHRDPPGADGGEVVRSLFWNAPRPVPLRLAEPSGGTVIGTSFTVPATHAALVARWPMADVPDDAMALMEDAAHSVRLAMERDEAEQAHQQAAALRRSHRLQRDFLGRLSHELRTPLTAIRGYASSLLASDVTWDEESKGRFLNRIASESDRLGRLVGDLLDFSAIESGLLRLQYDWCDLGLVLEAAISCIPGAGEAVSVDCPAELGPVWADHDRLEQLFVNLIDNALRHNAPGVKVRVEVGLPTSGMVMVCVQDDGRGIPEGLRAQLFEPQARGATSAPGAGLGLSIARGIATAHGGTIDLEPSPQGARFSIELPLEGPGAPAGDGFSRAQAGSPAAMAVATGPAGAPGEPTRGG